MNECVRVCMWVYVWVGVVITFCGFVSPQQVVKDTVLPKLELKNSV